MTDERTVTTTNGYNLTAGRSWHYADEAGDLAPLPVNWDDDEMTWYDDDAALDYEAKLQQAERTIANLRGELELQRGFSIVTINVVGIVCAVIGGFFGALIW